MPESWASPISTRAAIEAMPKGCVAVVDAMGITDAGIFGDILCERMRLRGWRDWLPMAWLRDVAGVIATGLPVWCKGAAAPPSVAGLTFVGWQDPIACGGVAVFADDAIVVDDDGAVVIPRAMLIALWKQPSSKRSWKPGLSTKCGQVFHYVACILPMRKQKRGMRLSATRKTTK